MSMYMSQDNDDKKSHKNDNNIYITRECLDKMKLYIEECPTEISGLGRAFQKDRYIVVTDIIILKQKCTSTESEMDDAAIAEFVSKCEDPENWRVFWHSHANMGVFWSGTDENTISKFGMDGWLISIVGNKRGEFLTRMDLYSLGITADCRLLSFAPELSEAREEVKKEIKELVSTPPPTYSTVGEDWAKSWYKRDSYYDYSKNKKNKSYHDDDKEDVSRGKTRYYPEYEIEGEKDAFGYTMEGVNKLRKDILDSDMSEEEKAEWMEELDEQEVELEYEKFGEEEDRSFSSSTYSKEEVEEMKKDIMASTVMSPKEKAELMAELDAEVEDDDEFGDAMINSPFLQ